MMRISQLRRFRGPRCIYANLPQLPTPGPYLRDSETRGTGGWGQEERTPAVGMAMEKRHCRGGCSTTSVEVLLWRAALLPLLVLAIAVTCCPEAFGEEYTFQTQIDGAAFSRIDGGYDYSLECYYTNGILLNPDFDFDNPKVTYTFILPSLSAGTYTNLEVSIRGRGTTLGFKPDTWIDGDPVDDIVTSTAHGVYSKTLSTSRIEQVDEHAEVRLSVKAGSPYKYEIDYVRLRFTINSLIPESSLETSIMCSAAAAALKKYSPVMRSMDVRQFTSGAMIAAMNQCLGVAQNLLGLDGASGFGALSAFLDTLDSFQRLADTLSCTLDATVTWLQYYDADAPAEIADAIDDLSESLEELSGKWIESGPLDSGEWQELHEAIGSISSSIDALTLQVHFENTTWRKGFSYSMARIYARATEDCTRTRAKYGYDSARFLLWWDEDIESVVDDDHPGVDETRSFLPNLEAALWQSLPVILSSIAISGPTSVDENSSADYTCTAHYSDGSTQNVTSSASWSENSSYASISSSGRLTTNEVPSDQPCRISATYSGKSDTHDVTIRNVAGTLNSITISGPTSVDENSFADYTCTAHYSDGSTQNVTSSASWSENSSYASISSSGRLTTNEVPSDQPCRITATYSGKSDTHDITIRDVGETHTLTIGVVPPGSGTTTPPEGVYAGLAHGASLPVAANANAGYHLDHWELDGADVGSVNPVTVLMYADHHLEAMFAVGGQTLTVAVSPRDAATLTPAAGTYPYPDGATATVVVDTVTPGYTFSGWILDGTPVGSEVLTYTVLMEADHTVVATFRADGGGELNLFVDPVGSGLITDWEGQPLALTQPYGWVDVLATPADGYAFVSWEYDALKAVGDTMDLPLDEPQNRAWMPNGDLYLTAHFGRVDITPADAWLFGGIIAEITIEGGDPTADGFPNDPADIAVVFDPDDPLLPEVPVEVLAVEGNDTLFIEVPPVDDDPADSTSVITGVMVLWGGDPSDPPVWATTPLPFTYKRYDTVGHVQYTAFVRSAAKQQADTIARDISLFGAAPGEVANLELPVPTDLAHVDIYGLVRTSAPDVAELTGFDCGNGIMGGLTVDLGAATLVPGTWDVDLHVYRKGSGAHLSAGARTLEEVYWEYLHRSGDASRFAMTPDAPALLTMPTYYSGLTWLSLIDGGIATWCWCGYGFDYVLLEKEYGDHPPCLGADPCTWPQSLLQSVPSNHEIDPTPPTRDADLDTTPIDAVTARLYQIGAFSLRQGAASDSDRWTDDPADPFDGVRLVALAPDGSELPPGAVVRHVQDGGPLTLRWTTGYLGRNVRSVTFVENLALKHGHAPQEWAATVVERPDDTSVSIIVPTVPKADASDWPLVVTRNRRERNIDVMIELYSNADPLRAEDAFTYWIEPGAVLSCLPASSSTLCVGGSHPWEAGGSGLLLSMLVALGVARTRWRRRRSD